MNVTGAAFTVEHPTPDTLPDLYALHGEDFDVAAGLAALRERLAAGRTRLDRLLVLRSARGVEGTATLPPAGRVPVLPRFRPDVPPEGMMVLVRAVRRWAEPEQRLILDSTLAPLEPGPVEAGGWALGERHVLYETDLRARVYPPDPGVIEGGPKLLGRPDVQGLLAQVGRLKDGWDEDWTLAALIEEGEVLALRATGPVSRPGRGPVAAVDLVGVLPRARGRGLGTRLHAHLLALAAGRHAEHAGATETENVPMRRIFERHGARLVATQFVFQRA